MCQADGEDGIDAGFFAECCATDALVAALRICPMRLFRLDVSVSPGYAAAVESVTVRDLRNRGGEVLDRVERGERVIVTRDGRAVAELRPLPRRSARPVELIERRKGLPRVDPDVLRRDIDTVIDPTL
jgi:prevent-host-death family protein